MITLFMVVEGQTEEAFAKRVLQPHLMSFGVNTTPYIVKTGIDRKTNATTRGGGDWTKWRGFLRSLSTENRNRSDIAITSLIDLYAFPGNFPNFQTLVKIVDTRERADAIERAMALELPDRRFIPYVQRHEFEALVLVNLEVLSSLLESPENKKGVVTLRKEISGKAPEDVNDGQQTAPSKRLKAHGTGYDKVTHGPQVTEEIGLPALRAACPRFDAWLKRLEALGAAHPDGPTLPVTDTPSPKATEVQAPTDQPPKRRTAEWRSP